MMHLESNLWSQGLTTQGVVYGLKQMPQISSSGFSAGASAARLAAGSAAGPDRAAGLDRDVSLLDAGVLCVAGILCVLGAP